MSNFFASLAIWAVVFGMVGAIGYGLAELVTR